MALRRILVANRGEVAVRIERAAAGLGLQTVAVHSEDDAASAHVFRADAAQRLPGSGVDAYLDVEMLLDAAVDNGCDAVHPGYGFLSEDPNLAIACAQRGLTFVGPDPGTLRLFGDKERARERAVDLGLPVLRAADAPTPERAAQFFAELGPGAAVMVKARTGGGGRGMRPVHDPEGLASAYARCRAESIQGGGDGTLYVEELLPAARHVEVQLLGDGEDVVTLHDRDCSLQRHRQKVVEIAPCPGLSEGLRDQLSRIALALGQSVGLSGLATVELLVAGDRIAFLEVNPRLQVEHTVTEEVCGIDLVAAQIEIAGGARLSDVGLGSGRIPACRGTAIQLRLNAEVLAPDGSVRPATGTLRRFQPPGGRGVRVDTHAYPGYKVGARYDSLLAKVVIHTPRGTLEDACRQSRKALEEFDVSGVDTNAGLLAALLEDPAVRTGHTTTTYLDEHLATLLAAAPVPNLRVGSSNSDFAPLVDSATEHSILAPWTGTVVETQVAAGEDVQPGQTLVVMEAMKMFFEVNADHGGRVTEVLVASGDTVAEGQPLVVLPDDGSARSGGGVTDAERDLDEIRSDLQQVLERRAGTLDGARPDAVARRHTSGHRTARENLAELCDPGSFVEFGGLVLAAQRRRRSLADLVARSPADGLVGGLGSIDGRRCVVMAYDYTVFAGTQGQFNHRKTDRLISIADRQNLPLVVFAEGGGGRPGDTDFEDVLSAQLEGDTFRAFAALSGRVPIVAIVSGHCFAGNAALAACSDVIIATRDASLGMSGPAMIEAGGLGTVSAHDVGPMEVQTVNGVVDVLVDDEADATAAARRYLSYFRASDRTTHPAASIDQRILRYMVPEDRRRVYDVRPVITGLCDDDSVLELREKFGVGVITALARIDGRPVGVVANNPRYLGGAIDGEGADKISRFLLLCDAFGLPLVSLCDTPGFMVGPDSERTATVRRFGRLFVVGASLRVPIFLVVLRKAYGLGAMAMGGGSFHVPAMTVSWPTGELGSMGLEGAVRLAFRKELAAIPDPAARQSRFDERVAESYERGKALNAASVFELDEVVDPAETRAILSAALESTDRPPPERRAFVLPW